MKSRILTLSKMIFALIMMFNVLGCNASEKKVSEGSNASEMNQTDTKFEGNPQYIISVKAGDKVLGDITIELFPDKAPKHVKNFDSLVSVGFYDGTAFHRVIDGFMIQGGDPNSKDKPKSTWGTGDPSQTRVPAEFNDTKHTRGIISAARTPDPNSATSQFFIMVASAPHLDGQYSAYGKVIEGMEVVDAVVKQPKTGSSPDEKIEMSIKKK